MIGIGIDTGGTYTDAVVYDMDTKQVLSEGKSLTTKAHLEDGIAAALDSLDAEAVRRAELLALSTTLATNACVEDKGSRARLLFIGIQESTRQELKDVYASYGFHNLEQLSFLNGRPEGIFSHPEEPDWRTLEERAAAKYGDCSAVGVAQIYPQSNGGRYEKVARRILEEQLAVPVTTAYDMFDQVDVLKRGAGTLLNARLIPLIDEFLKAVGHVMADRGLSMPVTIVRSDGSMMSELLARECPVETLLSGPAASAVGGGILAGKPSALIVDMGGTTTDIAIIREEKPVMAKDGIYIGPWKTMVNGLYVKTFALGGDSAVRFAENRLYLDNRRVIPLSVLAAVHPEIVGKLRSLADSEQRHTRMLHEFYVLQKEPGEEMAYTDRELAICRALQQGPFSAEELSQLLHIDVYRLDTQRLEEEGILMKAGLTPTDMMVVKGDFTIYDASAAREALRFLAWNLKLNPEELPDQVYELVEKKMYCSIARILLEQKYPNERRTLQSEAVDRFLEWSYADAKRGGEDPWLSTGLKLGLPLIGVGAPIHIFLPRVATLLGTEAVIPTHAAVANALGAIAGQVVVRVQVHLKAEYEGGALEGFTVPEGTKMRRFKKYEEAEAFARAEAKRLVLEKAIRQGTSAHPAIRIEVRKIESESLGSCVFFESIIEAEAVDHYCL